MDQRPGQNVDLGLYFHMEGPVSPKIRLKNQKMTEKIRNFQKEYLRVPLSKGSLARFLGDTCADFMECPCVP